MFTVKVLAIRFLVRPLFLACRLSLLSVSSYGGAEEGKRLSSR